jgi:hypothetical protein
MITLEMQLKNQPLRLIVENKPFESMKQTPNDGFKDDHEKSAVKNP